VKFKIGDRVKREVDIHDRSKGYKTGRITNRYSKPKKKYLSGLCLGPYPELYAVLWDNGTPEKGFLPHGLELYHPEPTKLTDGEE
jgi:hypothetical protein